MPVIGLLPRHPPLRAVLREAVPPIALDSVIPRVVARFRAAPLLFGTAVLFLGSVGAGFINYVFNIVMARERFLGPEGFGALAALSSFTYLDGVVATALTTATANKSSVLVARGAVAELPSLLRALSVSVGGFGLLGAGFLVLVSSPVARFLQLPTIHPVLVLAPSLVLALLLAVTSGALQGLLRFGSLAGVSLLGAALRLGFAILLVLRGFGVSGALLGWLGAALLAWVVSFLPLRRALASPRAADDAGQRRREEAPPLRGLFSSVGTTLVAVAGLTTLFSADVILAKHYLSAADAGLYGGLATLGRVVYFVSLPITTVMFPVVVRRWTAGRSIRRLLVFSGGGVVAVGVTSVALAALLSPVIIRWTLGERYVAGVTSLWLAALFLAGVSIATWLIHVAIALRRTGLVVLPLAGALLQVLLIVHFHASVRAILIASLAATGALVAVLIVGLLSMRPRGPRAFGTVTTSSTSGAPWSP